jgi:hypothetical protein
MLINYDALSELGGMVYFAVSLFCLFDTNRQERKSPESEVVVIIQLS